MISCCALRQRFYCARCGDEHNFIYTRQVIALLLPHYRKIMKFALVAVSAARINRSRFSVCRIYGQGEIALPLAAAGRDLERENHQTLLLPATKAADGQKIFIGRAQRLLLKN